MQKHGEAGVLFRNIERRQVKRTPSGKYGEIMGPYAFLVSSIFGNASR